ncbi:hypothetical protein V6N11_031352 [Hibiscus sabdariffa]|uniref:ENTH domain-containing protein n=1 Tax=Hibiscus sabdariffa TaxID=183260 RepID=A0ABR2SXD8_9ROSI
MKKAIGQTVRDLKRGVNKKVLKVPGIEQKVLDATSNEPWGPHGSLLADVAMATRNHHEYQIIMAVIWKRINDTGKNWRHVYKGLTILEYLVAHGSERIIDDIRQHASQISSLSSFQYIDSSGRDQGSNIRNKSQNLVALVNDKERIIEVRQKAAANRDKLRNTQAGGMRGSDSGGQGDSRARDRYSRGYEDHFARDGYRDDDYSGKTRNVDGDQYGTRSSSDRDRAFNDDGASSHDSSARADDYSQDGRWHEQKLSEQKNGAPCYEEEASESRSPVHGKRDGETLVPAAPRSSPPATNNSNQATTDVGNSSPPSNKKVEAFNEFDPHVSDSAALAPASVSTPGPAPPAAVPTPSTSSEIDLLGDLSDSWAVVPSMPETSGQEPDAHAKSGAMPSYAANQSTSNTGNQGFDNPFGDDPFKAFPSADAASAQQQLAISSTTLQSTMSQNAEASQPSSVKFEIVSDFNFGESFSALISSDGQLPSENSQFLPQELSASSQDNDILADILPPSGPANVSTSHTAFLAPTSKSTPPVAAYCQSAQPANYGQLAQAGASMYQPAQPSTNPYSQHAQPSSNPYSQNRQSSTNPYGQSAQLDANPYSQPAQPNANPYGQPAQPNANPYGQPTQPNAIQYGQPAQPNAIPYGKPAQPNANPFGQPAQPNANPYAQRTQPSSNNGYGNFTLGSVSTATQIPGSAGQSSNGSLVLGSNPPVSSQMAIQAQNPIVPAAHFNTANFLTQKGSAMPVGSQSASQTTNESSAHNNNDVLGGFFSQPGPNTSMAPQTAIPSSTGALAIVPSSTGALAIVPQPSKDKFEPKSAVWADSLSRGLVNLNISGPKTNPLADIGVDFDAINRKEKRLEKPAQTAVTSTITMGKAMGSGSGMGRAGASALRAPANPMMGSGMGMGTGMGAGPVGGMGMGTGMGVVGGRGLDMGGYGGMNQQPMGMNMGMNPGMGMNNGMNPGMGMNVGMNSGMGMNNMGMNSGMGMNLGMQSQSGMPGSYNPMMGSGGYPQQPHGGGGYQ